MTGFPNGDIDEGPVPAAPSEPAPTTPRPFTTGDPVLYTGPSADLDGKTGVVIGRWTRDESVIDVEIDGTRWSIPAARLTLVETVPALTTALWTDSYGDEHEVHPVGTEIVYNGIEDHPSALDGESAVITGHDLRDEVTPYEIRFTRVDRMASPDHFWVPAPTLDTAPAVVLGAAPGLTPEHREALADAFADAANRHELRADGRPQALPSSQAGLQSLVRPTPLNSPTRALAALQALGDAAIAWQDADPDQPAGITAEGALSEAITTWRKAAGR